MKAIPLLLALAASTAHSEVACSWNDPGRNPFKGSAVLVALVEPSVPDPRTRLWLAWAIKTKPPTDRFYIWRDSITGARGGRYSPHLTGMRFGRNQRCEEVDRGGWGALQAEPANGWCVDGHCALIPDVCGNVAFVRQLAAPAVAATGAVRRVPEPGSLVLVLGGLLVAWVARRRRA